MQLQKDNNLLGIIAQTYKLTFASDRPFVYVFDLEGQKVLELFVLSSVHPMNGRDDTVKIGEWKVEELQDEVIFSLCVESSVWKSKTYRIRCLSHRFIYEVGVEGTGELWEVNYFGGYYSGQVRWGSGYFWSGQRLKQGFNPEPNTDEINYFPPSATSVIDLTGVPIAGKGDWFFTPPPFCFSLQSENGWVGVGVEAQPGRNRFTEYKYNGQLGSFSLSLLFEGYTSVNGSYQLPKIGFNFGKDEYEVLELHVQELSKAGNVELGSKEEKPAWWNEPIFCGWGSQCYVASTEKGRAPDYARQALYDGFLQALESNGIKPSVVVLDDKWQASYGENSVDANKWPDLKGFIARQHSEGKKVLLWLKAWDAEGIPAEECIRNAAGLPLAVDPTNPAFEQRFRNSIRNMLSKEGYDADGFKIDFTARIPAGPGMKKFGDAWGLELMKLYLGIIHSEAKKVKSDALVMSHTPNPYLADVLDMIRLNDINTGKDVNKAMLLRSKVAKAACPTAIIDTDNWPITDKAAWREYLSLQPELGIPSLYYATHIDSTGEPLEEDDYKLIREVWEQYRKKTM